MSEEFEDNKNNGMVTYIWGPFFWGMLHFITFGYPIEPTNEQKKKYKIFFTSLGDVLPCKFCRDSYKEFIEKGDTKLTDQVFKSRETLTRWMYDIHNLVNKKLDVDYRVTYEDVVDRYEASRAKCLKHAKGCFMPLNKKAESYQKIERKDCPIISHEIATLFIPYAIERGFEEADFSFIYLFSDDEDLEKQLADKNDIFWKKRNALCRKIIHRMRCRGIPSLEERGKYKGLPTTDELKLIMLLSSSLGRTKLSDIGLKVEGYPIKDKKPLNDYQKMKLRYISFKNIVKNI